MGVCTNRTTRTGSRTRGAPCAISRRRTASASLDATRTRRRSATPPLSRKPRRTLKFHNSNQTPSRRIGKCTAPRDSPSRRRRPQTSPKSANSQTRTIDDAQNTRLAHPASVFSRTAADTMEAPMGHFCARERCRTRVCGAVFCANASRSSRVCRSSRRKTRALAPSTARYSRRIARRTRTGRCLIHPCRSHGGSRLLR